jgi:hypothetical protein
MKDNACRKKMPSRIIELRKTLFCRKVLSKLINMDWKFKTVEKTTSNVGLFKNLNGIFFSSYFFH